MHPDVQGRQRLCMIYMSLYRRGTSLRFMACEALLSGLRILGLDKRRNLFPIQGNQKALRRGELFDCLDQNILRIPVNP